MKALALVFALAVSTGVLTTGVFAQTTRNFGSVVFPGGTSATTPGATRNFGSVVFPGGAALPPVRGGSPVIGSLPGVGFTNPVPTQTRGGQNFRGTPSGRNTRNQTFVYAYPVYVSGTYDGNYNSNYAPQEAPPQQQQQPQNVTVVYPPQHASPVMIQAGSQGEYYTTGGPRQGYESPGGAPREQEQAQDSDTNRFLIAFKDHTIYSAVAYWADGETLHYFTTGNTHNQVSVSLIDRELTERLNKELGMDFKLPRAK